MVAAGRAGGEHGKRRALPRAHGGVDGAFGQSFQLFLLVAKVGAQQERGMDSILVACVSARVGSRSSFYCPARAGLGARGVGLAVRQRGAAAVVRSTLE